MVLIQGGKTQEMWIIFKFFQRSSRTIFFCPKDAPQGLHTVVKTLKRATSPIVAPFLGLKPLGRTLAYSVYEFTA